MAAERARFVLWFGLDVRDHASYARYRAEMAPILEAYGGRFEYDFVVSEVSKGPPGINRVFAIAFPDRLARQQFFDDERYRAVRRDYFEPAVGATILLAELGVGAGGG